MNRPVASGLGISADFVRSQQAKDEFDACRIALQRHFDLGRGASPDLFGQRRARAVDLSALAQLKGIDVQRAPDLPFEGMIERDERNRATIQLRSGLNRRRERFTLAHELGHWILQEEMLGTVEGRLFRGLSRSESELKEEERLANLLAAELLLPFDALATLFRPESPLESLINVCRVFGVSRPMAIRRIADVCTCNLALIQLVPFLFKNLDSLTEVDDAIFASGRSGTLFDREGTKLLDKVSYRVVQGSRKMRMRFRSPKGVIETDFEINSRPDPIPHSFALATIGTWPSDCSAESQDSLSTFEG